MVVAIMILIFKNIKNGFKMGFIFSAQQLEKIETLLITDVALDGIVTEKGVVYYKGV